MKRVALLAIACAVLAFALLWWGFVLPPPTPAAPPQLRALLLVEDDTGTYPMQLRKGLQESLELRGGTLRSERLSDVDPADPQLYTAVDALFLLSNDPAAVLGRLPAGHPIAVILNQEVRGYHCVLPDHEDGGWQAGLDIALSRPEKPVLVVTTPEDPLHLPRLKGAQRGLGATPYTVMPLQDALRERPQDYAVVLALTGSATLAMAEDTVFTLPLVGFDLPQRRVGLLEEGLLDGVVADNPYALGYLAGTLAERARGGGGPAIQLAPMRLVTPATLYDAENIKLMFPLLQ